MKKILLVLCMFMVVGCNDAKIEYERGTQTVDITSKYLLPPEMKDCKVYRLYPGNYGNEVLNIIKCPSGNTTTSTGGKYKKFVSVENQSE